MKPLRARTSAVAPQLGPVLARMIAEAVARASGYGPVHVAPSTDCRATASAIILASTGPSWGATALVAARSGFIATGQVTGTPGRTVWWQSSNGRNWRILPSYPPLGPTTCTGEGCGGQPNGVLVSDGRQMLALRGGADAGVWTSSDGLAWQRLAITGDIPSEQATEAFLMPGGVLLSDGTATWFGYAEAR